MTAPDELVQAVHDALGTPSRPDSDSFMRLVLDAVPDDFVKLDGTWRRLTPFQQRLIQHFDTDVEQDQ